MLRAGVPHENQIALTLEGRYLSRCHWEFK